MSDVSYIKRPNRPLHVYALAYLAFLYIPVLFLPLFSFNDSIYISFPLKGFTTNWYASMASDEPMHAALIKSLKHPSRVERDVAWPFVHLLQFLSRRNWLEPNTPDFTVAQKATMTALRAVRGRISDTSQRT